MGTIDLISAPVEPADRFMARVLWWLSLVVAPAVLITLELFHPANFTREPRDVRLPLASRALHDPDHYALGYFGPDWWFALHMIQTPMVCLVAIGLWRLLAPVGAADGPLAMAAAWLARVAVFVFLVFYTVLDAIGGIGSAAAIVVLQGMIADGTLKKEQADGADRPPERNVGRPESRRRRLLHQPDRLVRHTFGDAADRGGASPVPADPLAAGLADRRLRAISCRRAMPRRTARSPSPC